MLRRGRSHGPPIIIDLCDEHLTGGEDRTAATQTYAHTYTYTYAHTPGERTENHRHADRRHGRGGKKPVLRITHKTGTCTRHDHALVIMMEFCVILQLH